MYKDLERRRLYVNEWNRRRRERELLAGICIYCHSAPAGDGLRMCLRCRQKENARVKRYKKANSLKVANTGRIRRATLKEMGLCGCGRARANGKNTCSGCQENAAKRIQRLKDEGLCHKCMTPLTGHGGNKSVCMNCYDRRIAYLRHNVWL